MLICGRRPCRRRISRCCGVALPRTKKGIFFSSRSASGSQMTASARAWAASIIWVAAFAAVGSSDLRHGRSVAHGLAAVVAGRRRRRGTRNPRGTWCRRCSSSPMTSGWTQVSKITFAPSKPICGRVAGGEVLHMDRGRDHGAGDAEALADVALHLRAEDQFRAAGGDVRPRPRGSRR